MKSYVDIIKTRLDEEEFAVLSTDLGRNLLAEMAVVTLPGVIDLERWRSQGSYDMVFAAMRLSQSRRKGAAKFSRADAMWFDPIGLEQATAELVARHKAARFAGSLAIDLCCGIGGDTLALGQVCKGLVAVDRDPGMLQRASWNARVYNPSDATLYVNSSAETMTIPPDALVHIDPDRRARTASRAKKLEGYTPGLKFLRKLVETARGGAIKLGPASDFATSFGDDGFEIELTSLYGECKEATVWFGDRAMCRRRATALPSGETWTDRDGQGQAGFGPLDSYILEPDPALIRSGLLEGFAGARQLSRFAEGIDLLTGPRPIASGMITPFSVDAIFPLDLKTLRKEAASRDLGRLEIKTRGVDLRPEQVRKSLKLKGTGEATLFLVGGTGRSRAIFATRQAPCRTEGIA